MNVVVVPVFCLVPEVSVGLAVGFFDPVFIRRCMVWEKPVFKAVGHVIDDLHQVFEGSHLPLDRVLGILAFYLAQYPLRCGHFA